MPPYKRFTSESPSVAGSRFRGRVALEREVFWPIYIFSSQGSQAWVEREYQRKKHDEIGEPPIERALRGPSLVRPSPSSEEMRRAFRTQTSRAQRRSDGTFTVGGIRFEVPTRYRALLRVTVRESTHCNRPRS